MLQLQSLGVNKSPIKTILKTFRNLIHYLFCRGMNAMHVLGQYGRENAGALFDLFMECMPEYPIDKPDQNGNTGTIFLITLFT